jgi:hypothetical protein
LAAERYFEDGPPAPRVDENHDDFGDPDEWQIPE